MLVEQNKINLMKTFCQIKYPQNKEFRNVLKLENANNSNLEFKITKERNVMHICPRLTENYCKDPSVLQLHVHLHCAWLIRNDPVLYNHPYFSRRIYQ